MRMPWEGVADGHRPGERNTGNASFYAPNEWLPDEGRDPTGVFALNVSWPSTAQPRRSAQAGRSRGRMLIHRRRRRAAAAFRHELVELGLVLGKPQTLQE